MLFIMNSHIMEMLVGELENIYIMSYYNYCYLPVISANNITTIYHGQCPGHLRHYCCCLVIIIPVLNEMILMYLCR